MKTKLLIIIIFIFSSGYLTAQVKADKGHGNQKQIAPDICIVEAKIIKIVPARKKISKQSCKTAPCLAKIEIIKVEKTGRTFPVKFTKGQKIDVKFLCSLKKDADKGLPGLKKRDIFKASLTAKPKINTNTSEYQIQNYQKL